MTKRRVATLAAGVAVSLLFLWIALRNTDIAAVGDAMANADVRAIAPFLLSMLIFYWIRTYRWTVLLRPISAVRTRDLFGPVMIGYGANFLMPFQLGEVARSVAAREKSQLPFMPIAFSIFVERLFDFIVILTSLALALVLHPELPPSVAGFGLSAGAIVLCLIGLALWFTFKTEQVLRVIERLSGFLPGALRRRILEQLRIGAHGLKALRHGRVLFIAAATSFIQWSIIAFCIWLSLLAVGMQVSPPTVLLILALIVLGSSVPNAPGYIGSIQAGYVVAIEAANGDPGRAMAASIFYHTLYALTAILLGLIALRRAHLDLRTVTRVAPEAST